MAANGDVIEMLTYEGSVKQNGNSSEMQRCKVPELPPNKEFHFFVCHSQDSSEQVRIIVDNLEQLGITCRYHERDFVAGEVVLVNIHKAIEESMALLVVVSQDFANSKFCSHEVEQALHAKIVQGYTVIPIMVEPCDMPELMKHITYIDARSIDVNEMHLKIYDAFVKNEWSKEHNCGKYVCCRNFREPVHCIIYKENNGLVISFPLSPYYVWYKKLSMTRYRLRFSEVDRYTVWKNQIKVTEEDITTIEHIVSDSAIVKYKHIFSCWKRLTSFIFFLMELTIFIFSNSLSLFIYERDPKSGESAGVISGFLMFIVACWWLSSILPDLPILKSRRRAIPDLQERSRAELAHTLWQRVNRKLLATSKFLAVYRNDKLHLLKLDVKLCKDYFIKKCGQHEVLTENKSKGESVEAYATRIFDFLLTLESYKLLRKSTVNAHHPMANGAKCLCQLAEEHLLKDETEEALEV